jgi:ABC-type transporter Mla subunit MlaD
MAEPEAPRNLKRVWIGVLVLIVVAWIIYAATGGPSTPRTETGSTPSAQSP